MTKSEIKRAVQYVKRIIKLRMFSESELLDFLALRGPDRDWSKNK